MNNLVTLVFFLLFLSCTNLKKIVDKPIIFDAERTQLTLDYLSNRYGLEQEIPTIIPKIIVLHWTYIPTFQKSFEAFNNTKLPNYRPEIKDASSLNVSSQFLVDRNGVICRLMPETTMARHVIGLNHCSIGIENVGGTEDTPLTQEQIEANIWLVKYLKDKYDIDYLIGHFEYTNFESHPLWMEKDKSYRTQKTDPGVVFLNTVKKATKHLEFKPTPQKNTF